ncbi:suppressor APC domain-containing protein 2 isoform X2 [Thrips palmi]|uniref:Suppressor APC domain-containing protein 2 isoform X2 n=1 Tax=Thrips palmi TaxID=161013 RepID=A0A6P9ABK7_THRPL|nr:suppressor APC domain-containing protein 2 isoform X2 [Thrips palmi]
MKEITENMSSTKSPPATTLDGLPKKFVVAMRTLFDIMDDKRIGYVSYTDIENRWHDDGTKGLPKGVLDCLQKVTPPNGLLTFERFCAGLKICLLRNQAETGRTKLSDCGAQPLRPPSAPLLDVDPIPLSTFPAWNPSNISGPQHRAASMPQLPNDSRDMPSESVISAVAGNNPPAGGSKAHLFGPPKPPRTAAGLLASRESYSGLDRTITDRSMAERSALDKAEIRSALQCWQQRATQPVWNNRGSGDGKPAALNPCSTFPLNKNEAESGSGSHKRSTGRRREPRRHTLQNGIDYNMLKRMKQMEQEKEVLLDGLKAVDQAREWYLKQVASVTEKMKYLGRMGSHMEPWSETQQERIQLQRARVLEVNRHLAALTDGGERGGFPLQLNLAVHGSLGAQQLQQQAAAAAAAQRFRHQNLMLTEEVSKKNDRITTLEREKASLIRELYSLRRSSHPQNERGFV